MEKVRIQDDLYLYVNQEKIEELVIPDVTNGCSNRAMHKIDFPVFDFSCTTDKRNLRR